MEHTTPPRRKFLKTSLAALTFVGLAPIVKEAVSKEKKVRLLNADGKLVEVDESVVAALTAKGQRASNKDVQEWMNTSKL